ncbi:retrovirus-related pol polyprotein from transposon TNT 1-94, partial [Tanacetum coccineum]
MRSHNQDSLGARAGATDLVDEEETLILARESIKNDFGKYFAPQQELSAEQMFWLQSSNKKSEEPSTSNTPVKIEVPSELPKVSLVKKSLKKLRFYLTSFDKVVKVRTTPDAITEGSWGFEHTKKDKIISQDIVNIVLNSSVVICDSHKKDEYLVEIYDKCLDLEAELVRKNDMTERDAFNELSQLWLNYSLKMNFLHKEIEHLKKIYKDQFDSIKKTRACSKEHIDSLIAQLNSKSMENANLRNELRRLKGKSVLDNGTTISLEMFKLDIEPISHRLKNNRDAHEDYLKKTIKNTDTIHRLVECARKQNPSKPILDSACVFKKHVQELLVYVSNTCPSLTKPREKLVVITPKNKDKKVRFADPLTSSSNTQKHVDSHKSQVFNKPLLHSTRIICYTSASGSNPTGNTKNNTITQSSSSNKTNKVEDQSRSVKYRTNKKNQVSKTKCNADIMHSMLNANSKSVYAMSNECLFDVNHDKCVLDYVYDVNVFSKSNPGKRKNMKQIWKPMGKVYTEIGYKWKPTGRTFTIVRNKCPLTRFTSTKVVPLKETTIKSVPTPTLGIKVYSSRPKTTKSVGSSSKSTTIESRISNNLEPTQSGESTISNVPSSSLIDCRSGMLPFLGFTILRDLDIIYSSLVNSGTNLYTLSIGDMMKSSPICLLSKASKTKSWLWHRSLSHLNFGTINQLAKQGLVRGLPKLKFEKDNLCSACSLGKTKRHSHKPKSKDTNQEKLYKLHMDLCGLMRVESINRKKYILVIVGDYSRFTWVKFLRSKDKAPEFIIKFLKMIQVRLNATVTNILTYNGTEFVNQTLYSYYEDVGISHETSVARTPQQNGIFERRNRTLVEAARTMLIFAKAPLFMWAETVAIACYAQNHSPIRLHHRKTPYELLHDRKPDLSYLFPEVAAPEPVVSTGTPSSTLIDQDEPSPSTSQTPQETPSLVLPPGVEEADHDMILKLHTWITIPSGEGHSLNVTFKDSSTFMGDVLAVHNEVHNEMNSATTLLENMNFTITKLSDQAEKSCYMLTELSIIAKQEKECFKELQKWMSNVESLKQRDRVLFSMDVVCGSSLTTETSAFDSSQLRIQRGTVKWQAIILPSNHCLV